MNIRMAQKLTLMIILAAKDSVLHGYANHFVTTLFSFREMESSQWDWEYLRLPCWYFKQRVSCQHSSACRLETALSWLYFISLKSGGYWKWALLLHWLYLSIVLQGNKIVIAMISVRCIASEDMPLGCCENVWSLKTSYFRV